MKRGKEHHVKNLIKNLMRNLIKKFPNSKQLRAMALAFVLFCFGGFTGGVQGQDGVPPLADAVQATGGQFATSAAQASAAAVKRTPWAILLCKFKDDPSNPPIPLDTFYKLFTTRGAGTYNIPRFFDEWSHGSVDLSGSQVFGWITIDAKHYDYTPPSEPPPPGWKQTLDRGTLIRLARQAALRAGVPLNNFYADVVTFNVAIGGAFGGGVDGRPFACGDYRYVAHNGTQAFGQEMGHGYGMDHSRREGSMDDYLDPWDAMSTGNAYSANDPDYELRGPGLNAWNMRGRGWFNETRVWRGAGTGFSQVVQLRPLYRRDLSGALAAEIPSINGQGSYLVEFRIKEGWDGAIPHSAILVHRFQDNHSYIMPGTQGQYDLAAGGVLTINDYFGTQKARVEVLNIDEAGKTATVRLTFAGASYYRIIGKNSGKCLDVPFGYQGNGVKIQQYTCYANNTNQHWRFVPQPDGTFAILSRYSGKVLDVEGYNHDKGSKIQQYNWANGENQRWRVVPAACNGAYYIASEHNGLVLDMESNSLENRGSLIQ